jgi:UDP-N-acetylmuramoyl-tripeptide--D-alanyl-D-alanine ligase
VIALPVDELRGLGVLDARADEITGVQVDSRRVRPGDLFVAVGRGSEYLDAAREHGAAATLVPGDAFAALAAIGAAVRARSRARLVGITGSTGKTSTKDILAALLRPVARTVAAEGGHNNEIGLPLTLCAIEPDTEIVVAEMGMRGLGQIAALCEIARPDIGIVTSIGPVHLELLGTVERVAEAKAEVVAALPPGATAIVPADAPLLEPYLGRDDLRLVRVGPGGDYRLESFEPGEELVAGTPYGSVALAVSFTARHQARNALAAIAAVHALGLPLVDRLEVEFSRWRGEESPLPGGGLLINDAYNANPTSVRAALEHLVERAGTRRKVAVLGDMAELGPDAPRYHEQVGAAARELGVDVVVGVGALARGYGGDAWAPDAAAAVELVRSVVEPGDAVLVKASRALALETVAEALAGAPVA